MNCHGHDTRVRIVENYNIRCTAHIRLLNGQVIRSDAERDITESSSEGCTGSSLTFSSVLFVQRLGHLIMVSDNKGSIPLQHIVTRLSIL